MVHIAKLTFNGQTLGYRYNHVFDVSPVVAWRDGFPFRDCREEFELGYDVDGVLVTASELASGEYIPDYSDDETAREVVYGAYGGFGHYGVLQAVWRSTGGGVGVLPHSVYVEMGRKGVAEQYMLATVSVSDEASALCVREWVPALARNQDVVPFKVTTLITLRQWDEIVDRVGGVVHRCTSVFLNVSDRARSASYALAGSPGVQVKDKAVVTGLDHLPVGVEKWMQDSIKSLMGV